MKVLICIAIAIVAIYAVDKDEAAEDFKTRCLLLGSAFTTLTSLFGFNNQQAYPPVYYEQPTYYYYPIYDNQEVIYEYYPGQYFYYYPSYEYDIYSNPATDTYYYNRIGNDGRMQRQEINQNTYNEYARRNVVIRARQAERGIENNRQDMNIPPQPNQNGVEYYEYEERPVQGRPVDYEQRPVQGRPVEYEQRPVQGRPVTYESEYEQRPVQGRPVEYEQRPVQGRPVMYESEYEQRPVQGRPVEYEQRPVQGRPVMYESEYEQRPVQGRPVEYEQRPVQGRPVMYETVQPRPVVARPVQMVAVQQKTTSPLQSLLGLSRPQPQAIMLQPAVQPVQYVRSKN